MTSAGHCVGRVYSRVSAVPGPRPEGPETTCPRHSRARGIPSRHRTGGGWCVDQHRWVCTGEQGTPVRWTDSWGSRLLTRRPSERHVPHTPGAGVRRRTCRDGTRRRRRRDSEGRGQEGAGGCPRPQERGPRTYTSQSNVRCERRDPLQDGSYIDSERCVDSLPVEYT